ncbi:2'-5' RNA ligase family protein [Roseomonas stagni]|uniref:2'-5' RNA ligase family protein n=1 Tax=Falsiroseomonas algicola TaxID=2716930 RepID=A0A6M1LNH5_9PROT|nr:2'-5' RNA ligase family protein [Falsiroseomonas algicola]NGM21931.1 2'-5' RNA ligase family protein [Falsiroseomonas algicola]
MPLAIVLRLDDAAAAAVRAVAGRLWPEAPPPEYPPHVTLIRTEDEGAAPRLLAAMRALPAAPLQIRLEALRHFAGPPPVCWLAPAPDSTLAACHAALVTALAGVALHPHSQAPDWTPHVTLFAGQAQDGPVVPIEGWLVAAELVRFPPPVPLARRVFIPAA